MNEFMQKVVDTLKQEQTKDELTLKRLENQIRDTESVLRDRERCISVLEKALK